MPPEEFENLIVECARLFPCHRMACILNNGPLVIFHVSCPNAHQGRRGEQIGISGDDECRGGDGGNLGKGVRRTEGLSGGSRLARVLIDFGPALGTLRVSTSIGWPHFQIGSWLFPDIWNFGTCDKVSDFLVRHSSSASPNYEGSK